MCQRQAYIAFFQSTGPDHPKLGMLHCHLGDEILTSFAVELSWSGETPQQSEETGSMENVPKIQYKVLYYTLVFFPQKQNI